MGEGSGLVVVRPEPVHPVAEVLVAGDEEPVAASCLRPVGEGLPVDDEAGWQSVERCRVSDPPERRLDLLPASRMQERRFGSLLQFLSGFDRACGLALPAPVLPARFT